MSIRRITFAKAGMAALALSFIMMTGCGDGAGGSGGEPDFVAVTDITNVPVQMEVGTPLTLTGTVVPSNATNKTIEWSISTDDDDSTDASFNDDGEVEATAAGTLKVTATIVNGLTETTPYTKDFTITVYAVGSLPTVDSVTVSPATATVAKGGNKTFTATVNGTNSPDQTVTWTIVATGNKAGTKIGADGKLEVASDETLTSLKVKATSTVDPAQSDEATVTVSSGTGPSGGWTAVDDSTFYSGDAINGIAWGGASGEEKFVAVGDNGTMAYSPDGVTWTEVDDRKFQGKNINGIAWGGGKFVAVGDDDKMAYSPDGVTWTAVIHGPFNGTDIRGIAWGGASGAEKFVAVGSSDMAYSPDGVTWTEVFDTTFLYNKDSITGIAWGGAVGEEKFVAVGARDNVATGNGGKMAHSLDGVTWTAVTDSTFDSNYITGIAWGGASGEEKFVAVGWNGKMAHSPDGVTWTAVIDSTFDPDLDYSNNINGIAWGGGKFVAVGDEAKMATSTNGTIWTAVSGSTFENSDSGNDHIEGIAWGGASGAEKFVAVGWHGKMAYWDGQ